MTTVRMDKFLWAARFFKTRPLAARACELGRVSFNGQPAKPARDVKVGDTLTVRNDSGDFVIEVLALSWRYCKAEGKFGLLHSWARYARQFPERCVDLLQ